MLWVVSLQFSLLNKLKNKFCLDATLKNNKKIDFILILLLGQNSKFVKAL